MLCLSEHALYLVDTQKGILKAETEGEVRSKETGHLLDLVDLRELTQTEVGVKSKLIKFKRSVHDQFLVLFMEEVACAKENSQSQKWYAISVHNLSNNEKVSEFKLKGI